MSAKRSGEWGEQQTASLHLRGDGQPSTAVAYLEFVIGSRSGEMMAISGELVFGSGDDVDLRLGDSAVSTRHARLCCMPQGVFVEDLGSKFGTFVNGQRVEKQRLADRDEVGFGTRVVMRFMHAKEAEASRQEQIYQSGVRDKVTGLHNQQYFLERLEDDLSWAIRQKAPLVLLTVAVDGLSSSQEDGGDFAQDQLLSNVGLTLRASLRAEDLLARLSRGPFAVACRSIRPSIGLKVADRLRSQVAAAPVGGFGGETHITLSAGVAGLPDPRFTTSAKLLHAALQALDRATKEGNCSILAAGQKS
ncbi:MAG: diguanylate cyclase [Deltaproteobacteria bacterium]|nr:diguanylate cyclase [Deltaproteobacteria bacterium]